MAILDEPDIKPMADAVRSEINTEDIKEEFRKPSLEYTLEDIVTEATFAILDFDGWYFDSDSTRNEWIPTGTKDYEDTELFPIVKEYVVETLDYLRETEQLPSEPDIDTLTNKLVGLVKEWSKWYYGLRKEKDTVVFYSQKGSNDETYLEDQDPGFNTVYGDEDKNMGISNAYDEDYFSPWDTDIDDDPDELDIFIDSEQ